MRYRKTRSCLAWLAVAGGLFAIVLTIVFVTNLWEHSRMTFPDNLGNSKAATRILQRSDQSKTLKFAIVGDINNGTETFEEVISRLREEESVDFLVLLGDCASDPDPRLHKYFREEFSETGLKLPTFIVAGNHDVEPGRFDYAAFEAIYGPANFSFLYRGNLFIGLGGIHSHEKLKETLVFLEKTLQKKRSKANMVFVFMHYTARASDDIPTQKIEYSSKFQVLFEKYRVTYVFSGHYHRLARTEINGVVYFVTGGGGGRLREYDGFADIGLFHHLTIIKIRSNSIAELIIPIHPVSKTALAIEGIERWELTELLPCVKEHPVISGLVAILIFAIFIWGIVDRCRLHFSHLQ